MAALTQEQVEAAQKALAQVPRLMNNGQRIVEPFVTEWRQILSEATGKKVTNTLETTKAYNQIKRWATHKARREAKAAADTLAAPNRVRMPTLDRSLFDTATRLDEGTQNNAATLLFQSMLHAHEQGDAENYHRLRQQLLARARRGFGLLVTDAIGAIDNGTSSSHNIQMLTARMTSLLELHETTSEIPAVETMTEQEAQARPAPSPTPPPPPHPAPAPVSTPRSHPPLHLAPSTADTQHRSSGAANPRAHVPAGRDQAAAVAAARHSPPRHARVRPAPTLPSQLARHDGRRARSGHGRQRN